MRPLLGRTITAEEARPGAPPVALIGESLWRRQFGGDPGVLGRSITLNGQAVTIVGVMSATFRDPYGQPQDCWIPLAFDNPSIRRPDVRTLVAIARLRAGRSVASARAELRLVARSLDRTQTAGTAASRTDAAQPDTRVADARPADEWDVDVLPLEDRVAQFWKAPATALFAAVLLVLVIACINVATLLLARTAGRERELALRLALGAGRRHIARELTIETLVLAIPGALGGLLCAIWLQRIFIWLRPAFLSQLDLLALDARVLLVAIASTTLTVAACTLLPLRHALRASHQDLLRGAASGPLRHGSLRGSLTLLAIAEIALGVVLLAAATIVTRDLLDRLPREALDWRGKLTIRVTLPADRYQTPDQRLAYVRAATERSPARIGGGRSRAARDRGAHVQHRDHVDRCHIVRHRRRRRRARGGDGDRRQRDPRGAHRSAARPARVVDRADQSKSAPRYGHDSCVPA